MYNIYFTNTFKRRLKLFLKKHPDLEDKVIEVIDILKDDIFASQLKTHKLSGKLKNNWAISLTYEYRILFIADENDIYLTNIGTHDEIY